MPRHGENGEKSLDFSAFAILNIQIGFSHFLHFIFGPFSTFSYPYNIRNVNNVLIGLV